MNVDYDHRITPPKTGPSTGAQLVIGLVLMVPMALWWGFAFATLWGWFIVPLGGFSLGTAHAAGLGLLFGMLALSLRSKEREFGEAVGMGILAPAMYLFLGWILTLFMGA